MVSVNVRCDLRLPFVAVVQQFFLVVKQLLVGLSGKLEVGPFDNGVHRTGFLENEWLNCHLDDEVSFRRIVFMD